MNDSSGGAPETHRAKFEYCTRGLLKGLRKTVDNLGLNTNRLPKWIDSAKIRIGDIENGSTAIIFELSQQQDEVVEYREVRNDFQFIFGLDDYDPSGALVGIENDPTDDGVNQMTALGVAENDVTFELERPALTSTHDGGYHVPWFFWSLGLIWKPDGTIMGFRIVPFLAIIRNEDLVLEELWDRVGKPLTKTIKTYHDQLGDHWSHQHRREQSFSATAQNTVIVLGSYNEPYIDELKEVRDYLSTRSYDAHLVEDLGEVPHWSLEDKVRTWCSAARFCVVVDRVASGHLIEFKNLISLEKVFPFLQPSGTGSTYMTQGADRRHRFIKSFEFEDSVHSVLGDAIEWAENRIEGRSVENRSDLPWRY